MEFEEVKQYLKENLKRFEEQHPNNIFVISPYLHKDLINYIYAINEKGMQYVDVKDYSSDQQFGIQAFLIQSINVF